MSAHRAIMLVVEPDLAVAAELKAAVEALGRPAIAVTEFQAARLEMRLHDVSAIAANVRLGPFNGIHLAYTARHAHPVIKVLIYARQHDPLLAREAQRACAFYERLHLVPYALPHFLEATLPPVDRRDASVKDRRLTFRGGRRSTDLSSLHAIAAL